MSSEIYITFFFGSHLLVWLFTEAFAVCVSYLRLAAMLLCCMAIDYKGDGSVDERSGSMIMEYVSWRTWSDIHQTSGECQGEWSRYNREVAGERGKKRTEADGDVEWKSVAFHLIYVSTISGLLLCFEGWPFGFSFPQSFICNSYIRARRHIWPVFQLKSKGWISRCVRVAEKMPWRSLKTRRSL